MLIEKWMEARSSQIVLTREDIIKIFLLISTDEAQGFSLQVNTMKDILIDVFGITESTLTNGCMKTCPAPPQPDVLCCSLAHGWRARFKTQNKASVLQTISHVFVSKPNTTFTPPTHHHTSFFSSSSVLCLICESTMSPNCWNLLHGAGSCSITLNATTSSKRGVQNLWLLCEIVSVKNESAAYPAETRVFTTVQDSRKN